MPTPGLGHKSFMQIGREGTFATAAAATRRLGFIESSVQPRQGTIRGRTLEDSISRVKIYQGSLGFEARILTVLDYHTMLFFIDGVMGAHSYGSSGGVTAGANPYTHTFWEKTTANGARSLLNSYTIELGEGDIPAGKVQRLRGAKIRGVTIRGTAGEGDGALVTAEWDIVSRFYDTDQTPTASLTAAAETPVLVSEASSVDDGTADVWAADDTTTSVVTGFTMTLANRVADQRFMLGSINPLEAVRNDFIDVSLQINKEFTTKTMMASHVNSFTAGSPKLVFGNTTSKRITFDWGTAYITQYNHPVAGYGIVQQNATWEAVRHDHGSGNLAALKILVETTTATIS